MEASVANKQPAVVTQESALRPDVLEQLLKPEVQEALTTLVDNLPKLAEMTALLTKTYDLAQKVVTDRVLIQDTIGGLQEVLKPIEEKAKYFASAAIEANDRAETDETTIGLFGMLKMLKDPELQRMLRFGQAYLDILGERKQQS
ncbi:DUF1641 domain-containing protein [Paenibacillus antri]|uniref:DUF1641 domain-containing protein n=1 Tax=Paenibacillus antri TaxID=2582848 RepID=A0A5R9G743_9BACL|nr:DUF1641 domain-containing protein [Paenibacillus antri]TLS49268.1 DUF1641 domain-containing protein [Paenibacillus antri]